MATTVSELQVVVSADTSKAESGLSSLGSKINSIGGSLATAGLMAVAGAAVAAGAAATSSVMKFAEFQSQMNILKVTTGATDAQMASMSAQARQLGADMDLPATSSAGAAIAMLELAKAGLSVEQTQMAAKGALQLAAAAGIDEAKAAQLTAGALNAFGLEGSRATSVANQLAYAANASSLDAADLGQAVAQAGFIFKATGQPVESLIAAMIELGNAGLSGSDGATAVKNALMQATNPTDQAKKAMQQYGISLFDAQGKMKDLPTIVDTLNARLGPLTEQQRNSALATIFQGDGMKALIPLMAAGGDKLREHEDNLKKTNAASEQAQARAQGLEGAWKGLVSQWETAQEALGSKLAPAIESLIRDAAGGIGDLTPLLESVGEQVGNALLDGITRAKDLFRQLGDAWRTVKQVFGEGWEPSAEIEPLALAAGKAATEIKRLSEFLGKVSEAAGKMGAWDNFASGFETLATEIDGVGDRLGEVSEALGRLNGASGGADTKVRVLATAVKIVGVAFELWAVSMGQAIDTVLTFSGLALDFVSVLAGVGKAWLALARGDMPAYEEAAKGAARTFLEMQGKQTEWATRTAERVKQGFQAISGAALGEMPVTAAAVESNMQAANQAVSENSAGMAQFMEANGASMTAAAETAGQGVATATETGMASAVAAVEGQGPLAVAAAEGMGTGMASGIEAAAPAMAAAAESGATGAVAAVQGQSGAASGAGQSLGQALGSGLEGGILAYAGRVAAAAANLVRSAIGAAQAEGEIESPSKKTMYLGQMLDQGLIKGIESMAPDVKRVMRDLIQSVTDYAPVAGEIARVEREIRDIRDKSQTEALFRGEDMITIESELLRLKRDQVDEERRLLPIRQDVAAAEREVSRIVSGSMQDRSALLENDAERKQIRLQTLDLEKQLVGLDRDSKRAEGIQKQIDKLRDQDRLLGIEADKIRLTNDIAATAERRRLLGLGEILAAEEANTSAIGRQITALNAEEAVFRANEAIIKNATDNEIGYRQRLIAVFNAEGKPLQDRMTAGLALVNQLEAEGAISKELADQLRSIGKEAGVSTTATTSMGNAAAAAAPKIDAAAEKAKEMADQAQRIADEAKGADKQISALASSLGKLPSWFTPKGSSGSGGSSKSVLFGDSVSSSSTTDSAGILPMMATSSGGSGGTETHIFKVQGPDGRTLGEWYVRGREVAVSMGRA